MKRIIQLLVIKAVLTSVTVAAGQFNQVISIGDTLPAFSALRATNGKTYTSSDFQKPVLVLVSLSNMCPFSKGIEKDLKQLAADFKDKPVDIVAINYNANRGDDLSSMTARSKEQGFNFLYLRNEDQMLGRQLGTSVTPEFFVFGADRTLAYTGLLHDSPAMERSVGKVAYLKGKPSTFYVRDAINALLENRPVNVAETKAYGCTVEYRREAQ